jgi:O-antigen ligase
MRRLGRYWVLVAAASIAGLAVGIAIVSTRTTEYRSSAEVLVTALPPNDKTFLGLGVIHRAFVDARTMQTAARTLETPPAAEAVAARVEGWSPADVSDAIAVDAIGGTEVLAVSATTNDPDSAARIADAYAREALVVRWEAIQPAVDERIEQLRAREQTARNPGALRRIRDDLMVLETVRADEADPTFSLLTAAPEGSALGPPDWAIIAACLIAGLLLGVGLAAIVEFLRRGGSGGDSDASGSGGARAGELLALFVAAWLALLFVDSLPVVGKAENVAAVLVPLTWLAVLATGGRHLRQLSRHWREVLVVVPLLAWLLLSVSWATEWPLARTELRGWLLAAAIFPVVAASLLTTRHLRLALSAFVAGAALSVVVGMVDDELVDRPAVVLSDAPAASRFAGAEGDPNMFAAAVVVAIAFAAGLAATTPRRRMRAALLATALLLFAGLVASGSRGALAAAGAAVLAAIVLFRPRRQQALIAVGLLLVTALALPVAGGRLKELGDDAGRADLWRVAWRMTEDTPVIGVGLNQFRSEAKRHVREPGAIDSFQLIVDQPQTPHNIYVQVLAETGVVGLCLFLLAAATSAYAAWRAGVLFDSVAHPEAAMLSRVVLVGIAAMLAASLFISTGSEKRLWAVLALGPAMLVAATAMPRPIRGFRGRARPLRA